MHELKEGWQLQHVRVCDTRHGHDTTVVLTRSPGNKYFTTTSRHIDTPKTRAPAVPLTCTVGGQLATVTDLRTPRHGSRDDDGIHSTKGKTVMPGDSHLSMRPHCSYWYACPVDSELGATIPHPNDGSPGGMPRGVSVRPALSTMAVVWVETPLVVV